MKSIHIVLFVLSCLVATEQSTAQTKTTVTVPQTKKILSDEKGTAVSMNRMVFQSNGKSEEEIYLTYVNTKDEGRRVDITHAKITKRGQVLSKYNFIGGEKIRVQQYLEHKGDKEPKVEIELL